MAHIPTNFMIHLWYVVFVCMSVRQQDNLHINERICTKPLPEVCVRPTYNPLTFGDVPDYDLDPGSGL